MNSSGDWITTQNSEVLVDLHTAIQQGTRKDDIIQIREDHSNIIRLEDTNTEMNVIRDILEQHMLTLTKESELSRGSVFETVASTKTSSFKTRRWTTSDSQTSVPPKMEPLQNRMCAFLMSLW